MAKQNKTERSEIKHYLKIIAPAKETQDETDADGTKIRTVLAECAVKYFRVNTI